MASRSGSRWIDALAGALAGSVSRRRMLGVGGGSALVALGAVAAHRPGRTYAQADATPELPPIAGENELCIVEGFEATVRQGPNAGLELRGYLPLVVTPSGSLSGYFRRLPDDGVATPVASPVAAPAIFGVVGQASGRVISFLITLADGEVIAAAGTLENEIEACASSLSGRAAGPFVGPEPDDLGDWDNARPVADSGSCWWLCLRNCYYDAFAADGDLYYVAACIADCTCDS